MKHTTEQYEAAYGCQLWSWSDLAMKAIDACVDDFADEMKRKLRRKFMEGKSGWDDPQWPREDILRQLVQHVEKGDMVDVANFAMFAWNQEGSDRQRPLPQGAADVSENMETEAVDRLFCELSQFTRASTAKELAYRKAMRAVLVASTLEEAKEAVRQHIEEHAATVRGG